MVKQRTPSKKKANGTTDKAASAVREADINAFANKADKPSGGDKIARKPRTGKNAARYLTPKLAVTLKFNQYEWDRLEAACHSAKRSKMDFIRRALESAMDDELGQDRD